MLAAMLAGCSQTQPPVQTSKRATGSTVPAALKGVYKVGRPYRIDGVWYHPAVNYGYAETGIASWYGPGFQRRRTANGEIFDMNELSAAHQTLPLPSMVRVINMDNGRSLVLRVNDRGPFSQGRVIDVSRRAAQLLGFYEKGTARVKVTILPRQSFKAALRARHNGISPGDAPPMPAVPREPVEVEAVLADTGQVAPSTPRNSTDRPWLNGVAPLPVLAAGPGRDSIPNHLVSVTSASRTKIFVQAGSFIRYENAESLRSKLGRLARTIVLSTKVGMQRFFRVRLGPLESVDDADRVLQQVVSLGQTSAKIIVE